ncbi:hypothetical protein [Hymenobacter baengnokdamensis]|uniref:hypothetical protein n=1 Tax=Hymenobacter baengnokdamensis TaxID=2615203 RepID=UPI0012484986|nr:hypothetical protein [Hymenobacter baengnokdamensis]
MIFSTHPLRKAWLVLLAVLAQACSRHEPVPMAAPQISPVSVGDAQKWYQATYPAAIPSSTRLLWQRAVSIGQHANQVLLVPMAYDPGVFTGNPWQGSRYLFVTKGSSQALQGNIAELLLQPGATPLDTTALLARLYQGYQQQSLATPAQTEGIFLLYSASYHYLAGRRFHAGQLAPGQVRLWFQGAENNAAKPTAGSPKQKRASTQRINSCIFYYNAISGEYLGSSAGCGLSDDNGGYDGDTGSPTGPGDYGGTPGNGGNSTNDPGSGPQGPASGPTNNLVINTAQLKPCELLVMNNLKGLTGNPLLTNLQKLAGNTPGYNWTVKDGHLAPNSNAFTSSGYDISTNSVITTFDLQKFPDITDLSMARTMLHESFHAYLVAYFANDRNLANAEYSAMVDAYQVQHQDIQDIHHVEMTFWVANIADALMQYGQSKGYNLPGQFYLDMSWAGLEGTQAYKNLPAADKQRIQNTIVIELTGQDSNGNSATQSGKNPGC